MGQSLGLSSLRPFSFPSLRKTSPTLLAQKGSKRGWLSVTVFIERYTTIIYVGTFCDKINYEGETNKK